MSTFVLRSLAVTHLSERRGYLFVATQMTKVFVALSEFLDGTWQVGCNLEDSIPS